MRSVGYTADLSGMQHYQLHIHIHTDDYDKNKMSGISINIPAKHANFLVAGSESPHASHNSDITVTVTPAEADPAAADVFLWTINEPDTTRC